MKISHLTDFVRVMLDMSVGDAEVIAHQIDDFASELPGTASFALGQGVAFVNHLVKVKLRKSLSSLTNKEGEEAFRIISKTGIGKDLINNLKMFILLVYGSNRSAEIISKVANRFEQKDDPEINTVDIKDFPARETCDVLIIGSGAGGAISALELAGKGLDVIIVEEGRRFSVDFFRQNDGLTRFKELYREKGATVAIGRPFVVLPIGMGVGGTTLVNSGTCFRTPNNVLDDWEKRAGVDLYEQDSFSKHLDFVEDLIGVKEASLDVMGNNGKLALKGAKALDFKAAPLRRNAPGCKGSCQCAIGCPNSAKAGVHLNALPAASKLGARVVTSAKVVRILNDGKRAFGVKAVGGGREIEILSKVVILAAGATQSPQVLKKSGIGSHHMVGKNLAIHPALSACGWFDEEVNSSQGILQSVGIDEFHESDGILIEATSTPPGMGSMVLPGIGRELKSNFDNVNRLATLGAMVADLPSGRVVGKLQPLIFYQLAKRDLLKLKKAIEVMGEVLFAAGANQVLTGVNGHEVANDINELREIARNARANDLHLAAFHPTGTLRMGLDDADYPVDEYGRVRGVENLYVTDASVLPTCPEVNPQVTIMATARAIASQIVVH